MATFNNQPAPSSFFVLFSFRSLLQKNKVYRSWKFTKEILLRQKYKAPLQMNYFIIKTTF